MTTTHESEARLTHGGNTTQLRVSIEERAATLLLRLSGDFDMFATGPVEAALEDALRPLTRQIVFDLREVTFIDLAALRMLIRTNERSLAEAFEVRIVRPIGLPGRVFTLTRAGDQLTLVEDLPR